MSLLKDTTMNSSRSSCYQRTPQSSVTEFRFLIRSEYCPRSQDYSREDSAGQFAHEIPPWFDPDPDLVGESRVCIVTPNCFFLISRQVNCLPGCFISERIQRDHFNFLQSQRIQQRTIYTRKWRRYSCQILQPGALDEVCYACR